MQLKNRSNPVKKKDYSFSGARNINKVGWYKNNAKGAIHMVGQKDPNILGLFDMTGNVSEWVNDWFSETYYAESGKTNPNWGYN